MLVVVEIEHTYPSIYTDGSDYKLVIKHEVDAKSIREAVDHYLYDEDNKLVDVYRVVR